jgi:hypothetical protein
MWPYFFGLIFSLIANEGNEKEGENESKEHALAKAVRKNSTFQYGMQCAGCALMLAMWLLIIPYLPLASPG